MSETVGTKLQALRRRSGLSLKRIAIATGRTGASSVQRYFQNDFDQPLRMDFVIELAKIMVGKGSPEISYEELFALSDVVKYGNTVVFDDNFIASLAGVEPNIAPSEAPTLRGQPKDVPAFASALAADIEFDAEGNGPEPIEMTVFQMNDVVAHVRRPPGIAATRDVYVVFVSGNSMSPRYRPGDPVFVDPKRPPSIGDDVVVQLASGDHGGEIVSGLIKTLAKRSSSHLELEQYEPRLKFAVPSDRVAAVHRVIPWSECFGI